MGLGVLIFAHIGVLMVIYSIHQFFLGDSNAGEKQLAIIFGIGMLILLVTGLPPLLGPFVGWEEGSPTVVSH